MSSGYCLPYVWLTKITLKTGQAYGFSSSNLDIKFGGIIYTGAVGSEPTAIATKTGLSTDNLELVLLKTGTPFSEAQVALGALNDAEVRINIQDVLDLPASIEVGNTIFRGFVGRVQSFKTFYKLELRSQSSKINNKALVKTSPYCRWDFGSVQCGLNLAAANLQYTTTISAYTQGSFTFASAPPANAARYNNGSIEITSGDNTGFRTKFTSFTGSVGNVAILPPFAVSPGASVLLKAGCNFTTADCISFGNISNFGGFPAANSTFSSNWMPGMSTILASGKRSGEKA